MTRRGAGGPTSSFWVDPFAIGSPHPNVLAIHLVWGRGKKDHKDSKTINDHTLGLLGRKRICVIE